MHITHERFRTTQLTGRTLLWIHWSMFELTLPTRDVTRRAVGDAVTRPGGTRATCLRARPRSRGDALATTHGFADHDSDARMSHTYGLLAADVFLLTTTATAVTTSTVASTRKSVRIESNMVFTGGLVLMDAVHMPTGCGTWPCVVNPFRSRLYSRYVTVPSGHTVLTGHTTGRST